MPKELDHYLRKLKKIERKIKKKIGHKKNGQKRRYADDEMPSDSGPSESDHDSEIEIIDQTMDQSENLPTTEATPPEELPIPSVSASATEPTDGPINYEVLLALGDLMPEKPAFGPDISEDLARIWNTILKNGLQKENKQKILDRPLIPQNCKLLKAPKLNPEITSSVSDNIVNRDKKIEMEQNQLGLGISLLGTALSSLINNEEVDRLKMITTLSEAGRVLTDVHNMQTRSRKNLVFPVLDKKFLDVMKDVDRDEFLYGNNLLERIKCLKSVQRSGQSIKKPTTYQNRQGNLNGPPRFNQQRTTARQGHKKQPSSSQAGKYRSQYYQPTVKKSKFTTPQEKPVARK